MFSFCETYFRLVGVFHWEYAGTQFLFSVSQNQYGFTLAGYQNEKSATDHALVCCLFFNYLPHFLPVLCIAHAPISNMLALLPIPIFSGVLSEGHNGALLWPISV